MPDPDPLEELRTQVRATQEAAQRLMADGVPPHGWEGERSDAGAFGQDVQALAALLQTLRELLPPDLREQVADLIRGLLLVLRALIDWLVAAIEERSGVPAAPGADDRVEDIPIA
ncbi:hypothetical protein [Capillimicrobium parvum]|nr:hypothetical protein [Capillimicrobium parvum]